MPESVYVVTLSYYIFYWYRFTGLGVNARHYFGEELHQEDLFYSRR